MKKECTFYTESKAEKPAPIPAMVKMTSHSQTKTLPMEKEKVPDALKPLKTKPDQKQKSLAPKNSYKTMAQARKKAIKTKKPKTP